MNHSLANIWLALTLGVATPVGGAVLPQVTADNAEALRVAMAAVGPDDNRVIRLTRDRYNLVQSPAADCFAGESVLPAVVGRITLIGQGAVITGGDKRVLPFCVEDGATLILRNMSIQDFSMPPSQRSDFQDIFAVAASVGELHLDHVTIRSNGSTVGEIPRRRIVLYSVGRLEVTDSAVIDNSGTTEGGILVSHGELLVRDSSFVKNRLRLIPSYPYFRPEMAGAFEFRGPTQLHNVTISGNSHGVFTTRAALIEQTTIVHNGFGLRNTGEDVTVRNSIIALNENMDCSLDSLPPTPSRRFPLNSRGVNLDSDGSCGLDPDTDLVATDPQLEPLRLLDGKIPGHEPEPGSPVLNRGNPKFCPLRDAVGRIRNTAADKDERCALGAVELPNEPPTFEIDARLTGTYYDPQHNGHYLSFQVMTIDLVAAVWWTYDPQGNPLWLVGSGKVDGDTARIPVYFSRGMSLPSLDDTERVERQWGTLEIEFQNCQELEMRWTTDQPGFTDGQATLSRLTINAGLGC